jgi:hypothetical protein
VLAITGAVFMAIYGLAIVRLKILTSEEVLMIQRRFERIGLRPSLRAVSVSAKGASGL